MNIILTFNTRHFYPDKNDPRAMAEAEFDAPSTIHGIKKAIESLGHSVSLVEANEVAYLKFINLKKKKKADLVFNYSEGLFGADREAQIPAMLEMLRIPYTGPTPLGYAIGLNKAKTKEVLRHYNVPTPDWQVVKNLSDEVRLKFPLIVKPLGEGSSKGIFVDSLVRDRNSLLKITRRIIKDYKQPAIVEEYLPGREFTVGIIGTPARVLPIVEIEFEELPNGMPKFDHYEAKWLYDNPKSLVDPIVCPALINEKLKNEIEELSLKAFTCLGFRDWGRLDIRLDNAGRPKIIEINCPPGINPDPRENSRIVRAAASAGLSFPKLIEKVINSALKRV